MAPSDCTFTSKCTNEVSPLIPAVLVDGDDVVVVDGSVVVVRGLQFTVSQQDGVPWMVPILANRRELYKDPGALHKEAEAQP